MQAKRRPEYGGDVSCRESRYLGRKHKHGCYNNWRETRAKEKYYPGEMKRVMREARAAGLLSQFLLRGLAGPLSQAVG